MKIQYLRKSKPDSINRRLEISEEKIREFGDIGIKTTQNGADKMTWQKRHLLPDRDLSSNPRTHMDNFPKLSSDL